MDVISSSGVQQLLHLPSHLKVALPSNPSITELSIRFYQLTHICIVVDWFLRPRPLINQKWLQFWGIP